MGHTGSHWVSETKNILTKGSSFIVWGLFTKLHNVLSQSRRSHYFCRNNRGQDFLLLLLSDAGEERESNSDDGWLVAMDNPEVELAVELGDDM